MRGIDQANGPLLPLGVSLAAVNKLPVGQIVHTEQANTFRMIARGDARSARIIQRHQLKNVVRVPWNTRAAKPTRRLRRS